MKEILEARGCELLYLPPYSPDLNPIEEAFAKLKRRYSGRPGLAHPRGARKGDGPSARRGDVRGCPRFLRASRLLHRSPITMTDALNTLIGRR